MTFYTLQYLQNHRDVNQILLYVLGGLGEIILVVALWLYLKNRFETKYRDLSIIMVLLMLLLFGLNYSTLEQHKSQSLSSAQVEPFLRSVAREKGVKVADVAINSTTLTDGSIVKIKNKYYRVALSTDRSSYTLERTHVIAKKITVKKGA